MIKGDAKYMKKTKNTTQLMFAWGGVT